VADVLAEAVVEVTGDIDKFNKDFNKSMKEMEREAKKSTDNVDKAFKQLSGDLGKEFERAAKEFARQQREQEREAARAAREIEREAKRAQREIEAENRRVAREIERENRQVARDAIRAQREMEAEAKRVAREIEKETARVARENIKAQKEYEKEFIATQRAMEKESSETQRRQSEQIRNHVNRLRKFASEKFSLSLGIDFSQITRAVAAASKLGAVLGAVGFGALAGQASLAGLAGITVAIQQLVGAIALLPAAGAAAGIVIGTLTLGLKGLGDAIKADSPAELAEAFKNLSENGKKFVTTVRDLKDEFQNLGKAVQQALVADFNKEVEQLAKVYLPLLEKGFVGVAKQLNLNAREFAKIVREAQTLEDVQKIFKNTETSVGILRVAIRPLTEAFRDIATVGSDFLPKIAIELSKVAVKFGDFISKARDSGELAAFFERAIKAVEDLFAIVGNVASIFNGINKAAESALGGGFLTVLRNATQGVENFVESARGQAALVQFFEGAKEAAKAILPVLGDLARLVLEVVLPALTKLGTIAAPGLQALVDGLRQGLERALPGIEYFVDALAKVVETLVDAGVLAALGDFVRVLGTELGSALRTISPTLGNLITGILVKLQEILPKILPSLAKFADAFGELAIAALPILDILAAFVSEVGFPTLQRIAEKLAPIIEKLASALSETLLPILPDLADAFGELVDALAPIAEDLMFAFIDAIKIAAPFLPPLIRGITELVKALTPIIGTIADIIEGIGKLVDKFMAIPGVRKFLEEELPLLLALLTGTIIVPIGKIIEGIDKFITKMEEIGAIETFMEWLGRLGDALLLTADSQERLRNAFETGWAIITGIFNSSIEFIITILMSGFNVINVVITTAWEIIKSIFSTAWEIIKAIVSAGAQILLAIITGNFGKIPEIVREALTRMWEAARDNFNKLMDLVRDLPSKIVSALGNLSNLLYSAGQDIVRGLINGITSLGGWLQEQARNLANSALQAAKNALASKSPSKKMMEVGEDFTQGFAIGINSMMKKAKDAGAILASQTVQTTSAALAPSDNSVFRMNQSLNRLTRNGLGPAPAPQPSAGATPAQTPTVVSPEIRVFIGNDEIDNHITDVVDDQNRRTKRSAVMGARRTV